MINLAKQRDLEKDKEPNHGFALADIFEVTDRCYQELTEAGIYIPRDIDTFDKLQEHTQKTGVCFFANGTEVAEKYNWNYLSNFWTPAEVPNQLDCTVYGWTFRRSWYYWRVTTKNHGLPPLYAVRLYEKYGKVVRVNGDCTGPDPIKDNKGFAISHYDIDTQDGLTAFVSTLKDVVRDATI